MTIHVHLLLTPGSDDTLSRLFQYLGRLYVHYFTTCLRYIELDPVRPGMVTDPGNYLWSSFRMHAFGLTAKLWSPHEANLTLGGADAARQRAHRALIGEALGQDVVARIRHYIYAGSAPGTEKFRSQVARMVG